MSTSLYVINPVTGLKEGTAMRAVLLGLAASLFFATTFVLNRTMHIAGGHWVWSGALRYLWMVPLLALLVAWRGGMGPLWQDLKVRPLTWLIWGTVGFGFCYAPLCYAAASGPGWLVAGTWQITIVAGMLLAPWLRQPGEPRSSIPLAGLAWSGLILVGVALMQWQAAEGLAMSQLWVGVAPVIVGAFAYPLGNRRMMQLCGSRLDAFQRTLGMTLGSLPFWLLLSAWPVAHGQWPSNGQLAQTAIVAVTSGVIATVLFFAATDAVKESPAKLAAVEATQAGEVVFAALGESLLFARPWPAGWSLGGLGLIVLGMVMHARAAGRRPGREVPEATTLTP